MSSFDLYPRPTTTDAGGGSGYAPGSVPSTGLVSGAIFNVRVPMTAGAGTAVDLTFVMPCKARLIDAFAVTTANIGSSVVTVFTAAAGAGTACTSALATSSTGVTRNALTTATQVFASGATVYCRQSGGATLAGGELNLTFQMET